MSQRLNKDIATNKTQKMNVINKNIFWRKEKNSALHPAPLKQWPVPNKEAAGCKPQTWLNPPKNFRFDLRL